MVVSTKITVDMTRPKFGGSVSAVQGDGNTRCVEITLLSGGQPWTPPEGVDVAIAYYHPGPSRFSGGTLETSTKNNAATISYRAGGGTKGLYNQLADGTAAISISGNVATVILAPQMLADSGTVTASLVFNDAQLNRLTTFPFSVSVTANPAAGAQKTEDYIRLKWLEDKLDEYLRKAADSGEFDGAPGVPGHTPEYGVDYGTPEQIADIANQAAGILADDIKKISAGKVDKAEGMGLSSNDYDNAAKAKVDAIPKDPKYTDTVYDDTEVKRGLNQIKDDISNLRFGDPYDGVDLVAKFADEISGYTDPGAWIRARIRANNFDGIHVNDYLAFTTTNGLKFKARVAGIDPYYEYGDSAAGHHIDFVCEELWPTLHPINPINYNNGLIPTENVTSDGSSTQYVLTKPMYGVAKVTLSGTDLTGWTYDKDTYTLTFSTAPAAGTMVVTGTGSEHPWLASDAYLYVNSLAGHVPNGTGLNPEIKRVDYTNDGIYHYLPDWLKAVIIEKRFLLNKRYSASGVLSDENGWGWVNLGKLWFPTEVEVYGCPVWSSNGGYGLGGSIQYPYFVGNMRRVKKQNGRRTRWWLLSPHTTAQYWCYVGYFGTAGNGGASGPSFAVPVCFRIG